jgi:predicted O-methyltransferase YrrM
MTWGYHNPPSAAEVILKLKRRTQARSVIFPGESKDTVPYFINNDNPEPMDLIYIDGGHSIETIREDWTNAQKLMDENTVVFFDDYFMGRMDKGCRFLEDEIDKNKFDVSFPGEVDDYTGDGRFGELETFLMMVRLR